MEELVGDRTLKQTLQSKLFTEEWNKQGGTSQRRRGQNQNFYEIVSRNSKLGSRGGKDSYWRGREQYNYIPRGKGWGRKEGLNNHSNVDKRNLQWL